MLRTLLIAAVATWVTASAAADAPFTPKWEASADVYGDYNPNHPFDNANFIPGTGTTAKRAGEFSLNLGKIGVLVDPAPVGFHLSLGVGTGMEVLHSGEPPGPAAGIDVWRFVEYASVSFVHGPFTVEAGILPSYIGLESFESQSNWAYTRSWIGELSPYYLTGVRGALKATKAWTVQLLVLNGWQVISDNNHSKAIGAQAAYASDRLTGSLNLFFGPELPNDDQHWRFFGDLIGTVKLTDALSVSAALDGGVQQRPFIGDGAWYAGQINGRYQLASPVAVALRAEVYDDHDGVITGTAQVLTQGTVTVELKPVEHLILKLEARYDHSSQAVFSAALQPDGIPDFRRNEGLLVAGVVMTL